jgi:hypothetical protein
MWLQLRRSFQRGVYRQQLQQPCQLPCRLLVDNSAPELLRCLRCSSTCLNYILHCSNIQQDHDSDRRDTNAEEEGPSHYQDE